MYGICQLYLCMGRKKLEKYEEAYEMYLEGLSLAQVGLKMGISRQSVYTAFDRRGYILRGPNFQPIQYHNGEKYTLRPTGYYERTIFPRIAMHRAVWESVNGTIPENYDIHHINEDKADNRIENLECLPKALHTKLYSPHNNQYGKGRRPVVATDKNGIERRFSCTSEAALSIGRHMSAINSAIRGESKTCAGMQWRYE